MLRITVLVDNTPNPDIPELVSEHGLSMLIEFENKTILCDTGKSYHFAGNARILGIDLSRTDMAFMSHGHNDHTGGLRTFLEINGNACVFASPDIFKYRFFSSRHEEKRDISTDFALETEYAERFKFVDDSRWIAPDIASVRNTCNAFSTPIGNLKLTAQPRNSGEIQDNFCHENALVFNTDKGLVIISSCSHNGALNIIRSCMDFTGVRQVCAFVGGLHFVDCNRTEQEVAGFCKDIAAEAPDTLFYTGHCTSDKAKDFLKGNKNIRFFHTGSVIEI